MSSFWPKDLSLDDTQSPYEVLLIAREEWEDKSAGAMTLVLERGAFEDGNTIILVYAKHVASNRTATLLSVVHRPKEPYPATIQPRKEELPDILRRSHYQTALAEGFAAMALRGQMVENKWVCDTPSEFREKLIKALNLPSVKTAVLSLASDIAVDTREDKRNATQGEASQE